MDARGRHGGLGGFTLMELMVVVGLISLIAAIAIPQLLPVIAFSTHEGAARHLAGYGQNAMGRAALMHEKMVVHVDLAAQEYWSMRWPEPEPEAEDGEELLDDEADERDSEPLNPFEALTLAQAANSEDATDEDFEKLDEESQKMLGRFDLLQKRILVAQAAHVKHEEEGILDEIDPLFEEGFGLEEKQEELEPEEISEPLLERTRLTEGIVIDSVIVGEVAYSDGVAEIELSPTGLTEKVIFYVRNEDREYFTVVWDPIVGNGRIREGKVDDP